MKTKSLIIIGVIMMAIIPFVTYSALDWYNVYYVFPINTSYDIDGSPKPGDKYYIEPERKTQLEAVELDLRNKILQLHHQKNPLGSFAVNLDHLSEEIVVIVETEQFNTEIEEMISQYPDDIPIVFSSGKFGFIDEFEPESEAEPESNSEINRSCMTLEQSKDIAPFFKVPSYLPEGYSMKCTMSGMPYESYIIYHNKEVSGGWMSNSPMLIGDGAIFIYQYEEKHRKEYETYGSPEQRIQETYDDVMVKNPSLQPQLIRINGMLAYAVDSCPDCGMQTANFTDGTVIQKSTSTETKIKFIDENGIKYMLKTTLPLNELIRVAESLG